MPEKRLFTTSVTEKSATDLEGVGTLRWKDNNLYRWVKNETGATAVKGDLVTHDIVNKAADLYESVIQPSSVTMNHLAGVWTSLPEDDQYGWILVKGVADVNVYIAGASQAVGLILTAVPSKDYGSSLIQGSAAVTAVGATNLPAGYIQLLVTVASSGASGTSIAAGRVNCIQI